jgi:outer membrane murein-binding lipoprotein Lpp
MTMLTDRDIDSLANDVKDLRAQFAKFGDRMNAMGKTAGEYTVRAERTGKRVLNSANDSAHYLVHEVEENPVLWAAAGLGIFSFFLMLFSGSRR